VSGFLRRQLIWISLILTLSSLFYFPFAYADEAILDFHIRISINLDASADITETITVSMVSQEFCYNIFTIQEAYSTTRATTSVQSKITVIPPIIIRLAWMIVFLFMSATKTLS
jgi:hypothetical protein